MRPLKLLRKIRYSSQSDQFEFEQVRRCFPKLSYKEASNSIEGEIEFCARYDKDEKLGLIIRHCSPGEEGSVKDRFKISIELSHTRARVFEKDDRIREISQRTGQPLHLYTDGSCCLGLGTKDNLSLSQFIFNKVYPYFVWQAYLSKYEKVPPPGQYPHPKNAAELRFRSDVKNLEEENFCYCGSGKEFGRCCVGKKDHHAPELGNKIHRRRS